MIWQATLAQNAIKLGEGTYAEFPPSHEAAKPYYTGTDAWGDLSQKMTHMKLFVVDTNTRAVPSTDWWTTLVYSRYSDNLWAYPGMVNADESGLFINFPKYWNAEGRELTSKSILLAGAEDFTAESALARRWGAWTIDWIMNDQADKTKNMAVTIGHGLPFTWIEYEKLNPVITVDSVATAATYFNDNGGSITFPYTGDHLGIQVKGDHYGIFAPANTKFTLVGNKLTLQFPSAKGYVVYATMPAMNSLATFYTYAYAIPRDSKVTWNYRENDGKIDINWQLVTENLKGAANRDLIQGWLPHNYKKTTRDYAFNGMEYQTPRGIMKCAVGQNFKITYDFNGILPAYPVPDDLSGVSNPYRPDVMKQIINNYTPKSGYGTETYWGGKDLLNYAKYMQLAAQTGNTEAFNIFKKKLKDALTDWYTYTPGENYHYFAWYPNWGSFMGFNTRDNENPGIDLLQDHAFCYAYHIYAASILFMYDTDFMNKYQDFTKMQVRDYANWDRNYKALPWFRSMDPWCGHSFSGGVGDFNGNGQESSSEAMQAWGAMFMLGSVTNDVAMRDAAIFGYVQEAQGVAEYWFDRSHIPANGGVGNYDYTKFVNHNPDTQANPVIWNKPFPYNSNLVTQGIGWWTYFSGDWYWMHAIQWLPMSPFHKYLYEDINFAKWDYNSMWTTKTLGGWDSNMGNEAGVGNVTLSYLQISDPQGAAAIFDQLWDNNKVTARAPDTNAFTYWYTHSHISLGEIQWDQHTNFASSTVYFNARTNKTTVVAYNPKLTDEVCKVFKNGAQYATFTVPPRTMVSHQLDGLLKTIKVTAPADAKTVAPSATLQLATRSFDQYGAVVTPAITWSVTGGGSINASGLFTSPATNGTSVVTAKSGTVQATYTLRINTAPALASIAITPAVTRCEIGNNYEFKAKAIDQYGDSIGFTPVWSVTQGGTITQNGVFTPTTPAAGMVIKATAAGKTGSLTADVTYPLCNIALAKPVKASTEILADNLAIKINDGNESTRWESIVSDNEWVRIDLQSSFDVEKVILKWEAAFSKVYDIQISSDDVTYTTIFSQTNGIGSTEVLPCKGTGRYIKLLIKQRGTEWGNSVYEFEVYGTPQKTGSAVLSTIVIDPATAVIKDIENKQFTVKGFDQYGNILATNPTWSVIGRGTITNTGVYTPTSGSMYLEPSFTVVATQNGLTSKATVVVNEVPKLMKLDIQPLSSTAKRIVVPQGATYSFSYISEDQFTNPYTGPLTWSTTGGGVTSTGVYQATQLGDFMIFAQSGITKDTAFVSVRPFSEVNIALYKPTKVSSFLGEGSKGDKAVDADLTGTRWESIQGSDLQWISIDLKARYDLTRVVLNWESASAKAYTIDISDDGINWTAVKTVTNGAGGREELAIAGQGRYIRMNATLRNSGYGYSIWEFEVYAKSMLTTLSRIDVTPAATTVNSNSTTQFYAQGYDQSNNPISISPVWSVNGGSISASGVYTASATGNFTVSATVGSVSGITSVKVNTPPTVSISSPAANASFVSGTDVVVSANAADADGTIAKVELFVDGVLKAVKTTSPYSVTVTGLAVGTHSVYAVATDNNGSATTSATVSITVTSGTVDTNIALNKPATTSSYEGDMTATKANDGALNTRWGSAFADPQWMAIDLQGSFNISKVVLTWEAASGKVYNIETSNDNVAWSSVKTVTNGVGGTETYTLSGVTAKYIRIYGTHRNTGYGYSLWEFEVYGTPSAIGNVVVTGVALTPTTASIAVGATVQLTAAVAPVNATNKTVSFASSNNAVATVSTTGLVTGVSAGSATITATTQDGNKVATSAITVVASGGNLALNKPAVATTTQAGLALANINDGNTTTRWSSDWTDVQAVTIDLQASYTISKVVLNWEGACGKNYTVDVSADNVTWTTIYTTTTGNGGIVTISPTTTATGRYIRMNGTVRATGWGYSIWEFEVYGTAALKDVQANKSIAESVSSEPVTIECYPNPVTDNLTISLGEGQQFTQMLIFDMSGKLISQQAIAPESSSITYDFGGMRTGTFIIKLIGNESVQMLKVIKK